MGNIGTLKDTDLWWDAVIWIRTVIWALPVDAHLQELVDGGIHSPIVGAQDALDHLIVHAREHGFKVLHGLVELKPSNLPVGPGVVELACSRASTTPRPSITAATSEKAGHPTGSPFPYPTNDATWETMVPTSARCPPQKF